MKKYLFLSLILPALLWAGDAESKSADDSSYPLDVCVVSGRALDAMGGPYIHQHEGDEVRFCCKGCLPTFEKDPAKFLKKIQDAEKDSPESEKPDAKDRGHEGHDHSH